MTTSAAERAPTASLAAAGSKTIPSASGSAAGIVGNGLPPGWMFRANEQHTGVYSDGGVRPNNVQKWEFTTGSGGKQNYVDSSPAVVNGVVYVGTGDGRVVALDATTGAKLWEFTTGAGVDSSPAVVNGVVYVGSDDSKVYAIGNQPTPPQPTHIALTTSNPTPHAGQQFTLSGALTTDSGTGFTSQSVYIQELQGGTWVNINGPLPTDQGGAFSLAMSLTVPGPHSLRSHYSGTTQYAACDSPALTITIGGEVSPSPSPSVSPSPSPSVSPTTSPTATPRPSPEFPLAGFGAGVVMCALAAAYLMLRRD